MLSIGTIRRKRIRKVRPDHAVKFPLGLIERISLNSQVEIETYHRPLAITTLSVDAQNPWKSFHHGPQLNNLCSPTRGANNPGPVSNIHLKPLRAQQEADTAA